MKRCPTCNRTYSDESISFCLEDGAVLSAPYVRAEPPPTERISSQQLKPTQPAIDANVEQRKQNESASTILASSKPQSTANNAKDEIENKPTAGFTRYLPFIIIALVLIIGAVAFFAFSKKQNNSGEGSAFVNPVPSSTTTNATSTAASPTATIPIEKPNVKVSSPVVLEEYGDYQCPPCGLLYPVLKDIEHEYGKQLQIVFHHFPLAKIHKNAMNAARAAEAARNQGKFWEMHDRLYRNQNAWKDLDDPRPIFIQYARELGLNVDRFTRDLDSPEVEQRITADMEKGTSVGVTGTPTVFIEGQMLLYEKTTPDGLRQGINYMLQRKAIS